MQVDGPNTNPGHFALRVDDLDAAVTEISAAGVRVDRIPHTPAPVSRRSCATPRATSIELNQPE